MISRSPHETHRIAARIAKTLKGGDILALVGPLGAGKTTFVQGLVRALGIHNHITSPTFILIQSYRLAQGSPPKKYVLSQVEGGETKRGCRIKTFTHIDCYRLNDPEDLIHIGLRDHLHDPHTLTVIEWADKVKSILPRRTQWIRFSHRADASTRMITLK